VVVYQILGVFLSSVKHVSKQRMYAVCVMCSLCCGLYALW